MNTSKVLLFIVLILTGKNQLFAETWDEPWQKEILRQSEYFILAKIINHQDSSGTEILILKYFGNNKLEGKIRIHGFSMLSLGSTSGHGLHMNFEKGQTMYFFLNKGDDGNYLLPTPTSGFASLNDDGNVLATYRHSYHQALVPQEIYEQSYTEIWNYYKTSEFEKDNITEFIDEYITKGPAGFEEGEINTFFLQHVALETAYLLDISIELERLKKFIESENFHSTVSALQLLSNSKQESAKEYLFEYIKNEEVANFEKVIAIWSLSKIGGTLYLEKLVSIKGDLSTEENGFGGNIMDPRVGTYFPSPKEAVEELME